MYVNLYKIENVKKRDLISLDNHSTFPITLPMFMRTFSSLKLTANTTKVSHECADVRPTHVFLSG